MNLVLTKNSVAYAQAMINALWRLARPNPDPDDVTQYAVGWIQHPTTGQVALQIGDYEQMLAEDADVDGFAESLPVPASEKASLKANLGANRRRRFKVKDWLPPSLVANTLTDEQMRADGWYSNNGA